MPAGAARGAPAAADGSAGAPAGAVVPGGVCCAPRRDALSRCRGRATGRGRPPPTLRHVLHDAWCALPTLSLPYFQRFLTLHSLTDPFTAFGWISG